MGMGEPLYNYNNVAKALQTIAGGEGIAHHAVSGHPIRIVPEIQKCGEELVLRLFLACGTRRTARPACAD